MRFFLSYLNAFIKIGGVMGLSLLMIAVVERNDPLALYFLYVSLFAAFAGPISETIKT